MGHVKISVYQDEIGHIIHAPSGWWRIAVIVGDYLRLHKMGQPHKCDLARRKILLTRLTWAHITIARTFEGIEKLSKTQFKRKLSKYVWMLVDPLSHRHANNRIELAIPWPKEPNDG